MRYLILLFLFLTSTLQGTITRVQVATGNVGTTNKATFGVTVSALTAGNYLVVALGAATPKKFKITVTGAFDLVGGGVGQGANTTGSYTDIYLYKINVGGATTVTVATIDALTTVYAVVVAEYSGTNLIADIWSANTSSGSTLTTGGATPSVANSLELGGFCAAGTLATVQTAWATTPTNSFTIIGQTSSNLNTAGNDRAVALTEKILTSTSALGSGITNANGSSQWSATMVALREIPQVNRNTSGD
ncbi:MAG: hypothetical protein DMF62_00335 [Acidobacteria bacterium]|nr:MAG: hypothetical protein DMF62_00335 [Acidobacteriota bacterium]